MRWLTLPGTADRVAPLSQGPEKKVVLYHLRLFTATWRTHCRRNSVRHAAEIGKRPPMEVAHAEF